MHRSIPRLAPLAALLLFVSGCSGSGNLDSGTTPAPTSTTTKIETFTGVLTRNGAASFPFTVTGVGTVSAQLTSLTPDATVPVGLMLGTWNGSICQMVLPNDAAIQGSVVIGQSVTAGNFCTRIYDAAGTVVHVYV